MHDSGVMCTMCRATSEVIYVISCSMMGLLLQISARAHLNAEVEQQFSGVWQ